MRHTKYTPGPWTISEYGKVQDAEGDTVCVSGFALSMRKLEEAEANDHLCAAAPKMYEALVKLHCIIDFDEPVSPSGRLGYVDDVSGINEAMRLARAAIAKAEGAHQLTQSRQDGPNV